MKKKVYAMFAMQLMGILVVPNISSKLLLRDRWPIISDALSVADLLNNETRFAGRSVLVSGITLIQPLKSAAPCISQDNCPPVLGIALYLTQSGNLNCSIQVYKQGRPYPCSSERGSYRCGDFVNGETTTVTGRLVKTRVADAWTGSSGGSLLTPTHWEDLYYLDIE